jgi:hypothetical protein
MHTSPRRPVALPQRPEGQARPPVSTPPSRARARARGSTPQPAGWPSHPPHLRAPRLPRSGDPSPLRRSLCAPAGAVSGGHAPRHDAASVPRGSCGTPYGHDARALAEPAVHMPRSTFVPARSSDSARTNPHIARRASPTEHEEHELVPPPRADEGSTPRETRANITPRQSGPTRWAARPYSAPPVSSASPKLPSPTPSATVFRSAHQPSWGLTAPRPPWLRFGSAKQPASPHRSSGSSTRWRHSERRAGGDLNRH